MTNQMFFAKITTQGTARVLNSEAGMVFIVDKFTDGQAGPVAHVRDYRYPNNQRNFQTWSIPADGYEVIPTND